MKCPGKTNLAWGGEVAGGNGWKTKKGSDGKRLGIKYGCKAPVKVPIMKKSYLWEQEQLLLHTALLDSAGTPPAL